MLAMLRQSVYARLPHPTSTRAARAYPSTISSEPDSGICSSSLTDYGVPKWTDRRVSQDFVNEAKRRGLTPEACAKLLGRQAIQVKEASPKEGNIEERLTKLKNLYDKGLITKEEYEIKQAEILEGL